MLCYPPLYTTHQCTSRSRCSCLKKYALAQPVLMARGRTSTYSKGNGASDGGRSRTWPSSRARVFLGTQASARPLTVTFPPP